MVARDKVVVVGAGGFAREILALLRDPLRSGASWRFAGFVSTEEPNAQALARTGARWLGDDDAFLAAPSATHYVIAIADPVVRQTLALLYDAAGLKPATLIHPTASVGPNVTIGPGSIICAMASITTDVVIGAHVHVDRVVTIGHDSVIEDFVTLHPAGVISGAVKVGTRVRVGTNAAVLQGLRVGVDAVIGAGALVTRDVQEATSVVGVPARLVRPGDGCVE